MKELGIYIHIPFCVRKCGYCDFISMAADDGIKERYVRALLEEIRDYGDKFGCRDEEYRVMTVYMGGGTPSTLAPDLTGEIIGCIKGTFDIDDKAEITIEVNPGTVTYDKLVKYREYGINRLSIGLQSADEGELKALGRIHDLRDFMNTYRAALAAGFDNINVDIMTAIPGQTVDSLKNTLLTVTGLDPAPVHISAYSLILEEGTPFYERYAASDDGSSMLFGEEEERDMYHTAVSYLEEHGYVRYEISNFSLPGFESRHNKSYWTRRDYLGFGLSASSFAGGVRYKNTVVLDDYIKMPSSPELFSECISLSEEDMMSEFMFLGLRMSEGVDEDNFKREFGKALTDIYGDELDRLKKDGLIDHKNGCYRLSMKGIDYGNYVFSRFV